MATSSFDKKFVIKNNNVAKKFISNLNSKNVEKIKVNTTDIKQDEEIGLELLKNLLPF